MSRQLRIAADEFVCVVPRSCEAMARQDPDFFPCDATYPPKYPDQIGWSFGAAVVLSDGPSGVGMRD